MRPPRRREAWAPYDEAFAARWRALEAFMREHVAYEETSLFPRLNALLDDAVLTDLARRMEDRLDELTDGAFAPRMPRDEVRHRRDLRDGVGRRGREEALLHGSVDDLEHLQALAGERLLELGVVDARLDRRELLRQVAALAAQIRCSLRHGDCTYPWNDTILHVDTVVCGTLAQQFAHATRAGARHYSPQRQGPHGG